MASAQILSALLASAALAACIWFALSLLAGDDARGRRLARLAAQGSGAPVSAGVDRIPRWLARMSGATRDWRRRAGLLPDREKLVRAGLRPDRGEILFLAHQVLCLAAALTIAIFVAGMQRWGTAIAIAVFCFAVYAALRLPKLLLDRRIRARQSAIRRAWPEALDLIVIQIEAGRSPEQALHRVREEMLHRCRPLAEELALTRAELDVFERRQAYDNLCWRTDLDEVRNTCSALMQAYEQGTSLGETFRTLARESRDARFLAAEKKAAQLVSALPLPVAVFFLLPLVVLLVGPSLIRYMKWG